jgi:hypothetical protein
MKLREEGRSGRGISSSAMNIVSENTVTEYNFVKKILSRNVQGTL